MLRRLNTNSSALKISLSSTDIKPQKIYLARCVEKFSNILAHWGCTSTIIILELFSLVRHVESKTNTYSCQFNIRQLRLNSSTSLPWTNIPRFILMAHQTSKFILIYPVANNGEKVLASRNFSIMTGWRDLTQ